MPKFCSLKLISKLNKIDIVCISETYLDSSTAYNDGNLEMAGYNLIRSDLPSNKKRSGVSIYYKNSLPLKRFEYSLLTGMH